MDAGPARGDPEDPGRLSPPAAAPLAAPAEGAAARAGPRTIGSRLLRLLDQAEEIVASMALVVIVAAVGWGVLSRHISRQPAPWAGEVAILAFAWLIFLGAAACFKHGLHPGIDMLVTRLPHRLARLANGLAHLITIAFCILMVRLGIAFSIEAWSDPTPVLRLPYTVVYGPVTLGFALMLVRHVQFLLSKRRDSTGGARL